MAKPILTYDNGRRTALAGTAEGQLPTWDAASEQWLAELPPVFAGEYFVSTTGSDTTGNGSLSLPFATIQKAVDMATANYSTGVPVAINVAAGAYSAALTINRYNTFIRGAGSRAEENRATQITTPVVINANSASDANGRQIGICGCYISSSSDAAAVSVAGTGFFTVVIDDCYLTTGNAGASASAFACSNDNAKSYVTAGVLTVQSSTAAAPIVSLTGGVHQWSDLRIQHGSNVSAAALSKSVSLGGAATLFADRMLISARTQGYQIDVSGTWASLTTAKFTFANSSLGNADAAGQGITCSIAPTSLALFLWNSAFTVQTDHVVYSGVGSIASYGLLTFLGSSTSLSGLTGTAQTVRVGAAISDTLTLPNLTASLPLKLTSGKVVTAAKITAGEIVGGGAGTAGYYLKTTDGTAVEWAVGGGGGSGTVTSVSAGTGIAITGDNTVNPTVALAALSPSPAGTVGGAATVAQVTVDAYGRVTTATGVAIAIGASAITSGQLALARGGTGLDTSTVTEGQLLVGATGGGTFALRSASGDATLAATGAVTVTGLRGNPISSAVPDVGDVLTWNGSQYVLVPAPAGGSGGGGVVYFFNSGTAASGTGLPASTYQMGRTAQATYTSITASPISTGGWDRVAGFVTDAGDPNISTLPPGVWDLNLWATTASALGNVRARFVLYAYDNATDPELGVIIATSSEVELFDQGGPSQYIASLVIGAGVSLASNKRLYLKLEARASIASQSVEFGFGDAAPSHTHTTVPSVTGTGIVKVLNSVIVATGQQVDLATAAGEVTGQLPVGNGGTGVATANANAVFAGPTTGAAAAPGFRALVAADLPALPYDVSGEYPGTVVGSDEVFHFIAVRAFTIKQHTGSNLSRAYAKNAPTTTTEFTINRYPAAGGSADPVGTFSFAASANTATFTIGADKAFAAGDRIVITAPSATNNIATVYWTLFAVSP